MQGHLQPSRRPSPQGGAAAEQNLAQADSGPPLLGGSQPMGLPGVSGGPPLGPFGLLGQVGARPAQHSALFIIFCVYLCIFQRAARLLRQGILRGALG